MNYDPNVISDGSKQTVKLTFGMWDSRKEITVEVGGNCSGLTVIDCAVENVYDQLEPEDGITFITLTNANGDELECEDDLDQGADFLKNMLIGAEIIAIAPEKC